jgi:hypothetical protein
MKLQHPFYRLPVRFDVDLLRQEVAALPEHAWSRHPNDYQGNTAARLITVRGEQNDAVGGAMAMTPALRQSPYLQQVLASFNTVISRCRLMRIAPGEQVPQHSDINHHWFYRVRIHIPIYTQSSVRFYCEQQGVHMAAGESWIFDNWRQHRVENPSSEPRVHLVADTTGTSYFWKMVAQSQTSAFERPDPRSRLLQFDPQAEFELMIERFNVAPVMPPAEVEQLAFDLLADLAPANETQDAAAAVGTFIETVIDFTRDWRSLWHLHGDRPEARGEYRRLLEHVRQSCRNLPVAVASVGVRADHVLATRLLEHTLPDLDNAQEAGEFNRTPSPAAHSGVAAAAGGPAFTGALIEQARAPRPQAVPATVSIERPLIILSAPRSGSTLLFETLSQVPGLYTIGGESHALIEPIDALRPGGGTAESNRLTAADATPEIIARLRTGFAQMLRDRHGHAPPAGATVRLLEKTPKNALRIPFLQQVFPDAMFVFLRRDPRANISSIMEAWRSGGWVTYRDLPQWPGPWSLLLPPGYQDCRDKPLEHTAAFQWAAATQYILDDLATLPRHRWVSLRYEDLVASPLSAAEQLIDFAGLSVDSELMDYLSKPLPNSLYTATAPAPDKWRRNAAEIESMAALWQPIAERMQRL